MTYRDDMSRATDRDRAEVDAFQRFLALDLRPGCPIADVPEIWRPYVLGTGPAPERTA